MAQWLDAAGLQTSYTRFFADDPLPALDRVDMLALGGPMSVNDERGPAMARRRFGMSAWGCEVPTWAHAGATSQPKRNLRRKRHGDQALKNTTTAESTLVELSEARRAGASRLRLRYTVVNRLKRRVGLTRPAG